MTAGQMPIDPIPNPIAAPVVDPGILEAWLQQLSAFWAGDQHHKLTYFRDQVARRTDALTYLYESQRGDPNRWCDRILAATVDRIQSERFDIADLFAETRSLLDIIRERSSDVPASISYETCRESLDRLFEAVVLETSVVYELFSERGTQALCVLDVEGTVTFANRSAERLLGRGQVKGKPFIAAIDPAMGERVNEIIAGLDQDRPHLQSIKVIDASQHVRTLSAEFARVHRPTRRSAYYVSITPASRVFGLEDEILEDFEEGLVRVDANRTVYYANARGRKLLGRDPLSPVDVYDLLRGDVNRRKVDNELRQRETGTLGRYDAVLTKPSGRNVPISITAIPEFDIYGKRAGSLAFVRSREHDEVRDELMAGVHGSRNWQEAAKVLCEVLARHTGADIVNTYRWTDDMRHCATVAGFRDGEPFTLGRRWFEMSDAQIRLVENRELEIVGDIFEFFRRPEWRDFAEDPAIKALIENEGVRSFVRLPVLTDGEIKAGLALMATELDAFSEEDAELLEGLPIAEIVLSIIQRKDREEKAFQFEILKNLSSCASFEELATLVTSWLARHYGWDHVSIFDVIEERNLVCLLAQATGSEAGYRLPDDYRQDTSLGQRGLLGRAVREEKRIYAPDVDTVEGYKPGHTVTKAEIVIPIFSRAYEPARPFWLLNIEHGQTQFLLEHEIADLEAIAGQVEFFVNRLVDRTTYETALRTTSDGVIITDGQGLIRHANPAAVTMLGYKPKALLDLNVGDLFDDREICARFLTGKIRDSRKIKLRRKDKNEPLPVLLSTLQLSEEISDTYFIFKDLEAQERLANLETIEALVGNIAQELKVPLSLLHGMLQRLSNAEAVKGSQIVDQFVSRARELLKKVELTYDRVAYSEPITAPDHRAEALVRIDELLRAIGDKVSIGTDGVLDIKIEEELPPVSGDREQLRFIFDSLVSYLLRNLPAAEKIDVDLHETDGRIDARLSARLPVSEEARAGGDDFSETRTAMTLGRNAIRHCIETHRGRFDGPVFDDGRLLFTVSLPAFDPARA